jgi:hypothetical protein
MQTALRYVRAFFRALSLTLRGHKPPTLEAEERYVGLMNWSRETLIKLDAVSAAVRQSGLDARVVVQHVEGRDVSLEYVLSVVRFHLTREYPQLIRSGDLHTSTAIQAMNFNDQHLVKRVSEYEDLPAAVKEALEVLKDQLMKIVKE